MRSCGPERQWTRRGFLIATTAAAGSVAGRASAARLPEPARQAGASPDARAGTFMSRPDLLPPSLAVGTPAADAAKGYLFLAPFPLGASGGDPSQKRHAGPLIVADDGELVWFKPVTKQTAMNFRVQRYRGRNVLTWYEGEVLGQYGGELVVADRSYRELVRIKAGHHLAADLHEFLITSRGTALISIYSNLRADLSSIGGPKDGVLVEGVVQEVGLPSGRVLSEWHSRAHVGLDESYMTEVTAAGNVDYFHLNSVAVDADGHLLVSARHTSTVYKLDRRTGRVRWRLGGKRSDFALGPGAAFAFQHDVRRHADGTVTIFDNGSADPKVPGRPSRAIRLRLDTKAMQASLVAEYEAPTPRAGWAMGNVEQLSDGGLFVGWGTAGSFTEFAADGAVRYDASFADGSVTYRAFRFPWVGRPSGRPAIFLEPGGDGRLTVRASWNGATEVRHWEVRAGPRASGLRRVTAAPRSGFETSIVVPVTDGFVAVVARDGNGKELGRTKAIRI